MAKKADESLHRLVHFLTGSEIRYLKLHFKTGKSENLLAVLLDAILEQQEFDDDALFDTLKGRLKNRANFNVKKLNLNNAILKILRSFHASDADIDTQLRNDVNDIDLLIKKSCAIQAMKLVFKAKNLAYQYERYHIIPTLIQYEIFFAQIMFDHVKNPEKKIEKHIQDRLSEVDDVQKIIKFEVEISRIYRDMWDWFPKYTKSELQQLLNSDLFKEPIVSKLVTVRAALFVLKQRINTVDNPQQSSIDAPASLITEQLSFLSDLDKEGKLEILESHEMYYAVFLMGAMDYASQASFRFDTAEMKRFLPRIVEPKFSNDLFVRWQNAYGAWIGSLISYIEGDLKAFQAIVKKHEPYIRENERNFRGIQLFLPYYTIGANYLMHRNFKEAKDIFIRMLEMGGNGLKDFGEFTEPVLLNLLLISLEEENFLDTANYISKLKAYLKEGKYSPKISEILIPFAELSMNAKSKSEQDIITQGVYHQLKEAELIEENEKLLYYRFYYPGWFESKISGKPFNKIVAENSPKWLNKIQ